jgi:hypothetical protein
MSINTVAIELDSNPAMWLSDQRVQNHLPPVHALAYMNLLHWTVQLTATTGSDYVDGEFSATSALKRVPHLTAEALDAMLDAELVTQIDGDRWAVEYVTAQTSHEALQELADARARGAETRRGNKQAQTEAHHDAEEKAQRKREQAAERKRRQREKATEDQTESAPEPEPYTAPTAPVAHATAEDYLPELCSDCAYYKRPCGNVRDEWSSPELTPNDDAYWEASKQKQRAREPVLCPF